MSNERFITPQEVINIVFDGNMDIAKIKDNYIESAQIGFLKPAIGKVLYDSLVTNGLGAVTEDARLFKVALAYWVAYVASPFIAVRSNSIGYTKVQIDENVPLSDAELASVRANYISMASRFISSYLDNLTLAENALLDADDETSIIGGLILDTED